MFPPKQFDLNKPEDDDDDRSSEHLELEPSEITETEFSSKLEEEEQKPFLSDNGDLYSHYVDFTSPAFQDMIKATPFKSTNYKKNSPIVSLEILKSSACRSTKKDATDQKLSTNERIRLAGQWFIETYSSKTKDISDLTHHSSSGLSDDEVKDIKLLLTLLACAEKIGKQQFDCATKLIEECENASSDEGNPIERLVYYFSKAIREKVNRKTGRMARDGLERMQMFDLQEALMSIDASMFSFHHRLPMWRICQCSVIHTIIENVKKARKIHVIDLDIRFGMKYIDMLRTLVSRRKKHLEHVKITAIGTRAQSKIKDTGKRLADFARLMNIPFSFKILMVGDILDFNVDLLELDDDEKVAVCAPIFLSTLIVKPNHLDNLMRMIRKINPCITVIAEIEANHTSPAFEDRFIEALFFYGALFDSISYCLADDDRSRRVSESVFFGQTIRNIVAADGDERTIRHIGVDVWRSFFARFRMVEVEMNEELLLEAKSLIKSSDCESVCSVRVDGGCFLVDWNDVPMFSVSAWKFL